MSRMDGMPRAQGCAGAAIARLVALVPKPRVNLTRFHGVFAPNSTYRALVVPAKRGRGKRVKTQSEAPDQTPAEKRASDLRRLFPRSSLRWILVVLCNFVRRRRAIGRLPARAATTPACRHLYPLVYDNVPQSIECCGWIASRFMRGFAG